MKSYKEKLFEENKKNPNLFAVEGETLVCLQKVLLEIFLDVQSVCKKHNLSCMLLGGSALGAVRHKGFIPWDDDMDIGMARKDYEVFKKIFKSELGDKYILNTPDYEGQALNRFPKVLKKNTKFVEAQHPVDDPNSCIKIDIFVLDNVPNNKLIRLFKGLYCTFLMFAGGYTQTYEQYKDKLIGNSYRVFIGRLLSVFNKSYKWFNLFDKACSCKNEQSKDVGILSGRKHFWGEILPRECFFPASTADFESYKADVPANCDMYLKNLYGDYMTVPPEEKREKHFVKKIEF